MTDQISVSEAGGVVRVVLDAPERANALDADAIDELCRLLESLGREARARVVVIEGRGDRFCSGLSLSERMRRPEASGAAFGVLLTQVVSSPVPVIAKVNGHARAGGVALIGACDVAVAAEDATFGVPETRLGLTPGLTFSVLQPLMGDASLRAHVLSGRSFGAQIAEDCGLVSAVVPRCELETGVMGFVEGFLLCSPDAVAATKSLLTEGTRGTQWRQGVADGVKVSDRGMRSPDGQEGVRAFVEGRRAEWCRTLD